MSHAINTWREKLEYLLQQEANLADPAQKFAIAKQIAEVKAKIAELETPAGGSPTSARTAFRADVSRIDKYAPAELIGREAETQLLAEAWAKAERGEAKRPHVLTFVALGGEGKTSLVARWVAELAYQNWPGCEAAFAWSFYSQGTREHLTASSDLFLKEALTFFGDSEMANSAQGACEKAQHLAKLVAARRALLILDGLEPLQYGPTAPTAGELKDQGLSALLKGLAATSRGLCVITTRHTIPDLKTYWQTTAPVVELKRLSTKAGVALLKSLGVEGSQVEYEILVEDVRGHALTLTLLGTYLRDAHGGDIRKRDRVTLEEADAEEQGGHAYRVMEAYAQMLLGEGEKGQRALALLGLLGLFDRPATADCLEALWTAPAIPGLTEPLIGLSDAQRNIALTRLGAARLLSVNRDASGTLVALDAHPLLREYFSRRLREGQPDAWRAGHKRIYEHLCATTHEGETPTLDDLQPLYQAVAHGCLAGMAQASFDAVYFGRIMKREAAFAAKRHGAWGSNLGAIACFFEVTWSRVSPAIQKVDTGWLLNEAAYTLRALGRLSESKEPLRVATEWAAGYSAWINAAIGSVNLCELELTLGDIASARHDAEMAVVFADRGSNFSQRVVARMAHAEALQQAGDWSSAQIRLREAETYQTQDQPDYPLLYSLPGFKAADLLLAEAERCAWRKMLNVDPRLRKQVLDACRSVGLRAETTLRWVESWKKDLLSPSLDQLVLAQAALYEATLADTGTSTQSPMSRAFPKSDQALSGLRLAGEQAYVVLGLMNRAWASKLMSRRVGAAGFLGTRQESTQADLDEAWEIAERGPMPLFMADIHLHRARLFFGEPRYPWESPQRDLAEARRLIEKHGYGRRKEELEDAEAAILGSLTQSTSPAP